MSAIEVTYIDHMGSDLSVVNAARVSFNKKSHCEETRFVDMGDWCGDMPIVNERDTKLIRYLAREKHKSPFNHTNATFRVKAPIFVARQLQKHEYMPWNEVSRRYIDEEPEFYVPEVWRGRSADKKQGSEGEVDLYNIFDKRNPGFLVGETVTHYRKLILELYQSLLDAGVCPEQARMELPQSMMTQWWWSGTVFAFAKMCSLRCKPDTQLETQEVANLIDEQMAKLFPVSWEALRMYED